MTDLPDMKIKAVPVFPATTTGGDGIDVVREGGEYTIDLAYADFAPPASGLVDPVNETLLVWNVVTGTYTLAPVSLFGAGGGVPEAPTDGVVYGRKDAAWEVIPDAGLGSAYPSNEVPAMDSVAAPGVSALYSRGDHVHPSDATKANISDVTTEIAAKAVRYDTAQSLTEAQDAQARSNIYAAPLDALAYSGMQINGSMDVNQEKGHGTQTTFGYFADGWAQYFSGTLTLSCATNLMGGNSGFQYHIVAATTVAQPALAAGDLAIIYQRIEGYRMARLAFGSSAAQPITIVFWTCHHRTGTYCVSIENSAGNRTYVATYTQTTADAWERKTITISGDTAGTWAFDNTTGLVVSFTVASGTTYHAAAAGVWNAGNFKAVAAQVNGVGSTADVFRLTGVVVLPGIEAPSAERSPLIMRPFDQELVTCQRYWCKVYAHNRFYATGGGQISTSPIYWPVEMRATPTTAFLGGSAAANTTGANGASVTSTGMRVEQTSAAAGDCFTLNLPVTADARL